MQELQNEINRLNSQLDRETTAKNDCTRQANRVLKEKQAEIEKLNQVSIEGSCIEKRLEIKFFNPRYRQNGCKNLVSYKIS